MTTTAQHTPGKWRVDERSFRDTDGHIKVVRDHDSYWIASARVLQDSPGEATANARFIVTACNSHDALLEALKNLVLLVENHHNATLMAHAHTGPPDNSPCELHLGVAKQAIAQAEGRDQPASQHP